MYRGNNIIRPGRQTLAVAVGTRRLVYCGADRLDDLKESQWPRGLCTVALFSLSIY